MTNNKLTDAQLLFRLQDFFGAEQDASKIGDHGYAQECSDIVSVIRELQEYRKAAADIPQKYIGMTLKDMIIVSERLEERLDALSSSDKAASRIEELERICGESYQVVGVLADKCGIFETSEHVGRVMDNLSQAKLVHGDILPFWLG